VITIPESIAFYWGDAANRAAVDVLVGGSEVPLDLTLEEAERFQMACLAAQRVQVDFWRLLRSVWSGTWGEAVRSELPSARLLTYGGHANGADHDYTPSVDVAWDDCITYGVFDLPRKGKLVTHAFIQENDRELCLGFYFLDGEGDWSLSTGLDLGPDWTIDEDDWRITRPGLVHLTGNAGEMDLGQLRELSRSAVRALASALR
jgi:hypothetical protein